MVPAELKNLNDVEIIKSKVESASQRDAIANSTCVGYVMWVETFY